MKRLVFALLTAGVIVLAAAACVGAEGVTPGGLAISGQMYWEGDGDPLQWSQIWLCQMGGQQNGDPGNAMYATADTIDQEGSGKIGVNDGVCDIPLGNYADFGGVFLGHEVYALDLTVSPLDPNGWSGSGNLCFEICNPLTNEIAWSLPGPFTSEPVEACVEFSQPIAGYDLRLAVVPDVSPIVSLLSGLGLLAWRQRKKKGR